MLIKELETATDVDSACQQLQTLVMGLRPSDDILRKAGELWFPSNRVRALHMSRTLMLEYSSLSWCGSGRARRGLPVIRPIIS